MCEISYQYHSKVVLGSYLKVYMSNCTIVHVHVIIFITVLDPINPLYLTCTCTLVHVHVIVLVTVFDPINPLYLTCTCTTNVTCHNHPNDLIILTLVLATPISGPALI